MMKKCDECQTETNNRASNGTRLCDICSKLDKHNYICKSTIKTNYFLTDKDIDTIPYMSVKNPHYRCAADMKLYSIADVKNKFMEKHNCLEMYIDDKLDQLKQQRESRKEKMRNNKISKQQQKLMTFNNLLAQNNLTHRDHQLTDQNILDCESVPELVGKIVNVKKSMTAIYKTFRVNNMGVVNENIFDLLFRCDYTEEEVVQFVTRKKSLTVALSKYNLVVRADSKLCSGFLDGDDNYTANEIALIMKQMEWFFKNTNYRQIQSNLFRKAKQESYDYYCEYDAEEISASAKKKALAEYLKTNKKDTLPEYMRMLVK